MTAGKCIKFFYRDVIGNTAFIQVHCLSAKYIVFRNPPIYTICQLDGCSIACGCLPCQISLGKILVVRCEVMLKMLFYYRRIPFESFEIGTKQHRWDGIVVNGFIAHFSCLFGQIPHRLPIFWHKCIKKDQFIYFISSQ